MQLTHYSVKKLKKEILAIISRYLDLKSHRVFFFGSRVQGRGNERSDIDIGIEGAAEIPSEIMFKIKEEIDNLPTLYKIEIVDFKKISDDFREVALQFIEPITT
jgi:predicted nucleotidyltransferase